MKKLKKNNKGFSLVELIVVVLIIAIIAVALAPQVIKWVGEARTNTEENQIATIKSAVQTCVAEAQEKGYDCVGKFTVKGAKGAAATVISDTTDSVDSSFTGLVSVACSDLADANTYNVEVSATTYVVTVTKATTP